MEKIIYLVRAKEGTTGDEFRQQSLETISQQLLQNDNVLKLRMSFDDSDVERAAGLKFATVEPLPQAMFSVWVNTANTHSELVAIMQAFTSRIEGYLVSESEPMIPPTEEGQRTVGTCQVCTLSQLPELSREEFLTIWRDSHGQVAADTQSTFGYRQNLIVRKLTDEAQDHSAIVEEHFPADAMDSRHAFYDAIGDDEKLEKNFTAMMESVARFIDSSSINVVHMSEYTVRD